MLTGVGYRVTAAVDGRDALAKTGHELFDLVILDLNMPHVDGVGVLECLKKDPRYESVPVVALTAHAMEGDRDRFLAIGFSEYITKPVNLSLLRREVARLLEAAPPEWKS